MPMPISILMSVCVLSVLTDERQNLSILRKFVDMLRFWLTRTKITKFIFIISGKYRHSLLRHYIFGTYSLRPKKQLTAVTQ